VRSSVSFGQQSARSSPVIISELRLISLFVYAGPAWGPWFCSTSPFPWARWTAPEAAREPTAMHGENCVVVWEGTARWTLIQRVICRDCDGDWYHQNSGENCVVVWEGTAEYIADGREEIRPVEVLMEKFVMAVLSFYSGFFFCYCPPPPPPPFFFPILIAQKKEYQSLWCDDDRVFSFTHTANISIHKYTLMFLK